MKRDKIGIKVISLLLLPIILYGGSSKELQIEEEILNSISVQKKKMKHDTIRSTMPFISQRQKALLEKLNIARKSGDRATARQISSELDIINGTVRFAATSIISDSTTNNYRRVARAAVSKEDYLVNTPSIRAANPNMLTTPDGALWISLENTDEGSINLYRSLNNGKTWTHLKKFSGGFSMNPSMTYAVDPVSKKKYLFITYEGNSSGDADKRTLWVYRYNIDDATFDVYLIGSNIAVNSGDHISPEIVSDYKWYPSEPYLYLTYNAHDGEYDRVYFSTSSNFGATWTVPVDVAAPAMTSLITVRPDISFDDYNGNLYIVFEKLGWNSSAWKQQVWVTTSTNLGANWSTPVQLTSDQNISHLPRVAAIENTVFVAYVYDCSDTDKDVYYVYSTDGGINWNSNYILANSDADEKAVEVEVSEQNSGRFHAVYNVNNALFYKNTAITDMRQGYSWRWSNPIRVDNSNGDISSSYPMPAMAKLSNRSSSEEACFAWSTYSIFNAQHDVYFNALNTVGYLPALYYLLQ